MPTDHDNSSMTHQSKKKRMDEDNVPLPPDAGQRQIQLQRRRVWRACESCRSVRPTTTSNLFIITNFISSGAKRSNVMVVNPLVLNARHRHPNVPGSKPKIERL